MCLRGGARPIQARLHALQAGERAFQLISPAYTYVFLVVRSLIGPPLAAWLAWALCSAKSGAIAPGYRRALCPGSTRAQSQEPCTPSWPGTVVGRFASCVLQACLFEGRACMQGSLCIWYNGHSHACMQKAYVWQSHVVLTVWRGARTPGAVSRGKVACGQVHVGGVWRAGHSWEPDLELQAVAGAAEAPAAAGGQGGLKYSCKSV